MALTYVLITPARNEAELIEQTIQSVISQTIKPLRWVIVSDGSTDGTDETVTDYAERHKWIEFVRTPERRERNFAGKAHAFKAGYDRVKALEFDIIGNLDADITFSTDYFAFLLDKFADNPHLGVGGTPYVEDNRSYDYRFASVEHVSGACQLFRRECYEAIGGYKPIESGGIDLMAVTTARMRGWQTRSFLERSCRHHRRIGSASRSRLGTLLHHGRTDYLQGVHPAWAVARSAYHLAKPPYLVGGLFLGCGYFLSMLRREKRTATQEIVAYRRWEQANRLRGLALGLLGLGRPPVTAPAGAGVGVAPVSTGAQQACARGSYVLITPARNEAALIEQTIKCVVSQTLRPLKWVIVSDGSTDGTDEIVKRYSQQHDWMELVQMPQRKERHFGGKALAFNAGYEKVKGLSFDIIGNLDADITFDSEYFSFLITKFAENPGLGVGGTPYVEDNRSYDYRFASVEHVSGACQLFRRECYEAIGGYKPVASGGIDLIAVTSARMEGWKTRTFSEKTCTHHRKLGSATRSGLKQFLHDGNLEYLLGVHPAWEAFRTLYHMNRRPYVIGGVCLALGYCWPMILRRPRVVPPEMVKFRGAEQVARLRELLGLPPKGASSNEDHWTGARSENHGEQSANQLAAAPFPRSSRASGRRASTYAIITAARDEAKYIEKTIQSVISQKVLPVVWLVMDDGSTDGTDKIIEKYAASYPWIKLVRMPSREQRWFGGKARAFNEGWENARRFDCKYIVNLDGDVSFGGDFFEFLIEKCDQDPRIGIAGTPFKENGEFVYDYRFVGTEHVSGQCHFFRRECLEAIGGYVPVKGSGVDLIAVIAARMKGWRTKTFLETYFDHNRPMDTAELSGLRVYYKDGQGDYVLGSHPLWQVLRCTNQMRKKPYIIGGALTMAGYCFSAIRREPKSITGEMLRFRRRDQITRIRTILSKGSLLSERPALG
jgi:glycosyltransferase involved in cell wall biosynthesis